MENTSIDGVSDNAELTNVDGDVLEAMMSLGNGYPNE